VEVGRNVSEGTKKARGLFGHVQGIPVNRLPWKIVSGGTGGRPREIWMDGVRLAKRGLREEDS